MQIGRNTVVTVEYTLTDAQGNLIDDGAQPLVYLHGAEGDVLPKIEEALDGHEAGFEVRLQVEPDDAFGQYDSDLVKIEARSQLPSPLEVGMKFEGIPDAPDDGDDTMIFTVTDIADDKVVLDGNHPLAGIALRFTLKVLDVRGATEDEISHGHAHGIDGNYPDDLQVLDGPGSDLLH